MNRQVRHIGITMFGSLMFGSLLIALTPPVVGQEPQAQSSARSPENVTSEQLVAWSRMQKPRPTPQPIPPPDKGIPQPDQPADQPAKPQEPPQQAVPTQTFTGKIVKVGDKYVLKSSTNTTYQLSEQSSARRYEDQDVRIIGTLDAVTNTIRIEKIELLS